MLFFIRTAKLIDMIPKHIFWPILACMILWEPTRSDALKVLFHPDRRRIGGRGHFPSRDKDGGHTTRFAVSENPTL